MAENGWSHCPAISKAGRSWIRRFSVRPVRHRMKKTRYDAWIRYGENHERKPLLLNSRMNTGNRNCLSLPFQSPHCRHQAPLCRPARSEMDRIPISTGKWALVQPVASRTRQCTDSCHGLDNYIARSTNIRLRNASISPSMKGRGFATTDQSLRIREICYRAHVTCLPWESVPAALNNLVEMN